MEKPEETKNAADGPRYLRRLVRRAREIPRDLRWAMQAIRPNVEISVKYDWEPRYRLWRFMRKANCQNCGKRFREIEEGTLSKREQLCGECCLLPSNVELSCEASKPTKTKDNQ